MKSLSSMLNMKTDTTEFSEGQPRKFVLVLLCLLVNTDPHAGYFISFISLLSHSDTSLKGITKTRGYTLLFL